MACLNLSVIIIFVNYKIIISPGKTDKLEKALQVNINCYNWSETSCVHDSIHNYFACTLYSILLTPIIILKYLLY